MNLIRSTANREFVRKAASGQSASTKYLHKISIADTGILMHMNIVTTSADAMSIEDLANWLLNNHYECFSEEENEPPVGLVAAYSAVGKRVSDGVEIVGIARAVDDVHEPVSDRYFDIICCKQSLVCYFGAAITLLDTVNAI